MNKAHLVRTCWRTLRAPEIKPNHRTRNKSIQKSGLPIHLQKSPPCAANPTTSYPRKNRNTREKRQPFSRMTAHFHNILHRLQAAMTLSSTCHVPPVWGWLLLINDFPAKPLFSREIPLFHFHIADCGPEIGGPHLSLEPLGDRRDCLFWYPRVFLIFASEIGVAGSNRSVVPE